MNHSLYALKRGSGDREVFDSDGNKNIRVARVSGVRRLEFIPRVCVAVLVYGLKRRILPS